MCVPYVTAIGSIMYAMVCTCLDISHAVSIVSRYVGNLGKMHWQAMKWRLRHLGGTIDVCLVYDRNDNTSGSIVSYVDSDYARDMDKSRSLTRYIFTLSRSVIS